MIDVRELALPVTAVVGGAAVILKGGQLIGEFNELKRRVTDVETRQMQAVSRQELDVRFGAIDEKLNLLIKLFQER